MTSRIVRLLAALVTGFALVGGAQAAEPDVGVYHRLSTEFRGADLPLDVFNGGAKNNRTHLSKSGDFSGQLWRLSPAGGGFYKLTTQFRGKDQCLDIYNGGPNNNQPHLTGCANLTGQKWKLGWSLAIYGTSFISFGSFNLAITLQLCPAGYYCPSYSTDPYPCPTP